MNGLRQGWLVARRELRERGRSRAFLASVVLMIVAVVGFIVLPSVVDNPGGTKDVGVVGSVPAPLPAIIQGQSETVGNDARIHHYDSVGAGEQALREGDVDVLVVDGDQLEWRRQADAQLKAIVTGAIQLAALQERATAAGIGSEELAALMSPVPVENIELGHVAGRSADDETAAFIMTVLLFMSITTFGVMVLSGVVEEKSSRVVEVLLARTSPRTLLAGKIAGIGLLGLAQITATAVAALIAVAAVGNVDLPAVRGAVLVWAVVWFVLGYALYATLFGAFGSLASRPEDSQSVAGPISVLLILVYFVSFAAIGSPETTWARLVAWFPASAPIAMPTRIAMGAASWWEPLVAVVLTCGAIAGLVMLGGRVYAGAILHSGPTLKLRDAWQHATPASGETLAREGVGADALRDARTQAVTSSVARRRHGVELIASVVAIAGGAATFALTRDLVVAIAVGAALFAISTRLAKTSRQDAQHPRPPASR